MALTWVEAGVDMMDDDYSVCLRAEPSGWDSTFKQRLRQQKAENAEAGRKGAI